MIIYYMISPMRKKFIITLLIAFACVVSTRAQVKKADIDGCSCRQLVCKKWLYGHFQ